MQARLAALLGGGAGRHGDHVPRPGPADPARAARGGRALAAVRGGRRGDRAARSRPSWPGPTRDGRKLLGGAELRRALTDRDLVDFDGLVELAAALLARRPGLPRPGCAPAGRGSAWTSTRTSTRRSTSCSALIAGRRRADRDRRPGPGHLRVPRRRRRLSSAGSPPTSPGPRTVELTRNYRSNPAIVTAAMQAIAPATLVPGRTAFAGPAEPDRDAARSSPCDEAADEHAEAAWIAATVDQLLGGASFHSPGQRPGRRARARQARPGRHRRAVPHRRAGRAARPGADPGRAAVPEALARPARAPARRGRRGPRGAPGRGTATWPGG